MSKIGSTAIPTTILLLSFILIGATVASVITQETVETPSQDEIEKIVDDALKEITTYIQIKDKIGKYQEIDGQQKIQKIALLIQPLISTEIETTDLTVKIDNGKNVKILFYRGISEHIGKETLFGHNIWDKITDNTYGFIATLDKDRSLIDYNTINEKDMAFIIIKLSNDFSMKKGDTLTITLFPSSGVTKTINLEAPLPKPVITFD